jgi:(p)ppGpp synthase/HD superfamily hydrolase
MRDVKSLAAEIESERTRLIAWLAEHQTSTGSTIDREMTADALMADFIAPRLAEIAALQSRAFGDGARSAEIFARRVHAGQTDKGGAPYSGHLGRVAARACGHAEAMGLPRQYVEWCLQVGWLHDTIEDTEVTADDLLDAGFDPAVVQAVQLLTRPAGKPYLECVAGIIASGDRAAMIVKLSDNEDNLDPARALHNAWPALAARYQRSAEMLRAALAPNSTEGRSDRA